MRTAIREYRPADEEQVIELAVRAWTPVFAALERLLGRDVFLRLHGDWREFQEAAVRDTLADGEARAWVAEARQHVAGFVTARLHRERQLGEITMLAVDPADQNDGIGRGLSEYATDWLRGLGMQVAMVETGGDVAHAAARHVYEATGYTALPVVRYFKAL